MTHSNPNQPSVSVKVSIPSELHRQLRHLAIDRGTTLSSLIVEAATSMAEGLATSDAPKGPGRAAPPTPEEHAAALAAIDEMFS